MTKPRTRRADLAEVINKTFDSEWLAEFAEQLKGMTKGMWGMGECPECGSKRKVFVDVPDLKGLLAALTELMEQAEGRPGTAQGEAGGVTLVVERRWPSGGDETGAELGLRASPLSAVAGAAGGDEVGG